ncbi:MAG: hypothetical protein JHC31_04520 [Sulfurihydrogenibium sp.]|jgi:hypothetical protein|nr:hypothetical protein [Sulfurihydrogenibium sp.]
MVKKAIASLTAKAISIDKKTLALSAIAGVLGIAGFSMADGLGDFVTCTGAQRIYQYGQPIALFLAVVVFIVGIIITAFEAYGKKYGHAITVLLFAIVITGFFWGAGKALDTYGKNLKNKLCDETIQTQ